VKWLIAGLLLAAAIAAFVTLSGNSQSDAAEESDKPAVQNSTAIVRTDLVEVEQFDGTLRPTDDDTIAAARSGVVTALAEEDTVLAEGDPVYAVDGTIVPLLVAPTAFYRDLSLGDRSLMVEAPRSGTVTSAPESGAIVEQGDVLFAFDGEPVTVLYGDSLVYRDLYWPEPVETSTRSTQASDVQNSQSRVRLLDAITDAEEQLAEAQSDTPSNALLNAIEDLNQLEQTGGSANEISRANQAVTAAQQADLDRIAAAEDAVDGARQALIDFDEVQAAADRDELANETVPDTQPNLIGPDVLQLETALVDLGYDPDNEVIVDREFTSETAAMVERWQQDLGVEVDGIVEANDIVFIPGPAQVIETLDETGAVAPGAAIATLSFGAELAGPDVLQLEQALARLGFTADAALVVDDVFTPETRAALLDWQVATGQEPDGVLHVGDVVVVESGVRVTAEAAAVGTEVGAGTTVLQVADVEQIVSFDLDAADQSLADEGDRVTVILPDDVEISAVIEDIATTAQTAQDGSTTFAVTVRLDNPELAGDLTEAPVDVELVGSSVTDVLAVPVSALIALSEGGYAIEVDSGSGFRLVAAEPGFFADGLVEIDAAGAEVGDQVALP
jgi:peptidoglycan hydrolase-like protein with peptidoglycan-binding domain